VTEATLEARAEVPSPRRRRPGPPRWLFHGVAALAALALLWAYSYPGMQVYFWLGSLLALLLLAAVWLVRLVIALWRPRQWSWWFVVAPVGGLLTLALLTYGVPLHARFVLSESAFQAQVKDLPAAPTDGAEWTDLAHPERIGSYRIIEVNRIAGGVVFWEANGDFFDSVGFAWLPDGPSAVLESGSFENPQFTHLQGPWYAWTASW